MELQTDEVLECKHLSNFTASRFSASCATKIKIWLLFNFLMSFLFFPVAMNSEMCAKTAELHNYWHWKEQNATEENNRAF